MENDGSFVPQCYGIDISRSRIYRNEFCELLDSKIFGMVCELLDSRIFGLVFEGNGFDTRNI